MPAPKKIPPALHPEILAKAGGGATAQQIADWLEADHGIKVTRRAVAHHLKQTQSERSEITRAVAREKLAPTVTSDLDELEAIKQRLHEVEREARQRPELMGHRLRALELQAKVTDRKLHYSGAGEPDAAAGNLGVVVLPEEE